MPNLPGYVVPALKEGAVSVTVSEEQLADKVRQVSMAGRLDGAVAMNKGDELQNVITKGGGTVILDLSGVDFVASGGLRIFVRCAKGLDEAGGALHLAAAQSNVKSVLEVTGFDAVYPIHDTVEDALKAVDS